LEWKQLLERPRFTRFLVGSERHAEDLVHVALGGGLLCFMKWWSTLSKLRQVEENVFSSLELLLEFMHVAL
jgi:hypothetical protein